MDANLDGLYDHSQNCSWLIIARYHPTIRLHVLHMDIECGYDYLQVHIHIYTILVNIPPL